MDVVLILKAVGALSLIGAVSAILLGTAAQKFHVDVDPKVQRVLDALPGANCGACGNPSCFGAAEGIAEGRLPVTTCIAGGQEVADAIAEAMGQDACAVAAVTSCRHCGGGTNAKLAYAYGGVRSCNAASKLAGGSLLCPYGCLGYGDCVRACPFDAMSLDERGLPIVDLVKCTGCGICVTECPRGKSGNLLELIPVTGTVAVRCSSRDKIKARRDSCTMSCIACKKCEKACPSDAIHVIDMLAVVDYEKCTACLSCVAVCPQNCIDVTGRASKQPAAVTDGAAGSFAGFAPTLATVALEEADEA
ncbi:MAG: RnfABCDGE type electron transport complex subunit B [Coriobacteriia bacterium]|nr:RnfABCDGE type electron transport complex subunit B [Coriobacteriia bacterium]